jgi:hypothetical protein
VCVAVGFAAVSSAASSRELDAIGEIAGAADRFDDLGVDSYKITVRHWCFGCGGRFDRFRLTVERGELTRIVAHGRDRDRRKPLTEVWDEVPDTYEYSWIKRWGPIDRAFATMTAAVRGASKDGPAAMYFADGEHVRVTTTSFEPGTGVPREFSTSITNTYDSQYSVSWSNFRPIARAGA